MLLYSLGVPILLTILVSMHIHHLTFIRKEAKIIMFLFIFLHLPHIFDKKIYLSLGGGGGERQGKIITK